MNATRDPERILAAWLDEGPTDLPDATRRAILTALPTTQQARRGLLAPRRFLEMNGYSRLAAAALVAVVAVGGALYVIGQRPGPGPAVTPTPTAAATMATERFTSPLYGYTVEILEPWGSLAATERWPAGAVVDPDQAYVDRFKPSSSPLGAAVMMAAQPIPEGTTALAWMTGWAEQREANGGMCAGPASGWTDATVAGAAARRFEGPCLPQSGVTTNFVELVWVIDGTGYIITGAPPSVVELMAASFEAP